MAVEHRVRPLLCQCGGGLPDLHLAAGTLVLLHEPDEPSLNTLFLVQRPAADADPDVVRVRDALRHTAVNW